MKVGDGIFKQGKAIVRFLHGGLEVLMARLPPLGNDANYAKSIEKCLAKIWAKIWILGLGGVWGEFWGLVGWANGR